MDTNPIIPTLPRLPCLFGTFNPLLFTSHFFLGFLKQIFALLRRSIKLISNVCGLSFSHLTNLVCERHIKASSAFAERILADSEHPLHEELSKARSHTYTKSSFKLLPSKTAAYRNSVLPALSRLLVDRNAELNYYLHELS